MNKKTPQFNRANTSKYNSRKFPERKKKERENGRRLKFRYWKHTPNARGKNGLRMLHWHPVQSHHWISTGKEIARRNEQLITTGGKHLPSLGFPPQWYSMPECHRAGSSRPVWKVKMFFNIKARVQQFEHVTTQRVLFSWIFLHEKASATKKLPGRP